MKKISIIDCETDPFLHGREPKPFIWGYYDGGTFSHFGDTSTLILHLSKRKEIVYAHNGGKFDFHYILPYTGLTKALIINGRIVEMKLGEAILRDSFAILPMPLAGYKKDSIDYALFEKHIRHLHMAKIIAYLRDDCIYLYELVTAFLAEFGNKVTLASAGFARAKQMDEIARFQTNRFFYQMFKPYYHGGRVSIFKKGIVKKRTYIYDLNSAYPYAMIHNHPFGNQVRIIKHSDRTIDELSFYKVHGISNSAFPFFEEGKLKYPHDTTPRTYHVTGYELKAAMETNTFEGGIIKQYQFVETINFKRYIEHYYQMKVTSKKGSTDYILAKLAMNSVYGKLGANPDKYQDYIICKPEQTRQLMSDKKAGIAYLGKHYSLLAVPIDERRKIFYNVATAASITGFVRAMLLRAIHNVISKGFHVYYCDTDSLITDCGNLDTSSFLGEWKLEQTNDLLYLYAPKIYAAHTVNGDWKVASKGVQLTASEILKLIKGGTVTWLNDAPTFGVKDELKFIARTLKGGA